MKKLGLLVLTAAFLLPAALLVPAAPSSANTATDPTELRRVADPAVVWMSGRTVHTADGLEQTLPVPASHATSLRLLGWRHGSWIVFDDYGVTVRVLSIKGDRVRTIWRHVVYDPGTIYALSRGGDEIVQWFTDRGDRTAATVFDLKGHHVASHTFGAGTILDFTGNTLLLGFSKTYSWEPGSAPVRIAGSATWADAERDVLFVDDADYKTGPTSLSTPGTPPWTAGFLPRAISPDGAWVAGLSGTRLVVRSMTDGAKAAVTGQRLAHDPALAWEPGGTLLVQEHSTRGDALVRCTTGGTCERATDWLGPTISFPDQGQYFGNY
jgi:hypothetical protein